MLTFRVTNQKVVISGDEPVAESVKYLKAQFFFTSDWSNVNRYALFYVIGAENPVQININSGVCEVPAECIRAPYMDVSIYGSNAEGRTITTEKIRIPVKPSGLAEGNPPLEPPANIYEQVISAVDTILGAEEAVVTARDTAIDMIESKKTDSIELIQEAEGVALKNISSAGLTNSHTTFLEDGSIKETTPTVTVDTEFPEDGSIVETYTYPDGSVKVRTTNFLDNGDIDIVVT